MRPVTKVAFEGFPSYSFEGGRAFLIADVSIEIGTPDADLASALAWIAVVIYPVGLMAGNLFLLIKARNAIIDGKPTALSRAIAFLYHEYNVTTFWWEVGSLLSGSCAYSTPYTPTLGSCSTL